MGITVGSRGEGRPSAGVKALFNELLLPVARLAVLFTDKYKSLYCNREDTPKYRANALACFERRGLEFRW